MRDVRPSLSDPTKKGLNLSLIDEDRKEALLPVRALRDDLSVVIRVGVGKQWMRGAGGLFLLDLAVLAVLLDVPGNPLLPPCGPPCFAQSAADKLPHFEF